MTKPTPMKPQNHSGANSAPATRQRPSQRSANPVKKAPAPPPNPALVNPQSALPPQTPSRQATEESAQSALSTDVSPLQITQTSQTVYDKHSDGALTYFNYYFEDIVASSTPADYPKLSLRSKLPMGMVGVGVVAATITSGLMIGDALKPAPAPQSNQPQDAANQQDASVQSPRPTTIAPEKLETGRSLSASPNWSTSTQPTPVKQPSVPPLKRSQSAANSLITSGPLVSNSQPLKLQPLAVSAIPSGVSSSSLPVSSPEIKPSSSPSSLASEMVARAATLPTIAAPEALPQTSSVVSPVTPSPGLAANSNPAATASSETTPSQVASPSSLPFASPSAPSSLSSPATSTATPGTANSTPTTPFPPGSTSSVPAPGNAPISQTAYTSPVPQTVPSEAGNTGMKTQTTSTQPITAPGDRLLETSPTGLNRLTPTTSSATPNAVSESIQGYLNRPQKPTVQAQALMPLSSKAAVEAAAKPQIGAFTVRQVNQQEYQKEWLTSNPNPNDPAIAYAFPAYGFIDYQRQVIIVLREQPDTNPLQSKAPNLPNG